MFSTTLRDHKLCRTCRLRTCVSCITRQYSYWPTCIVITLCVTADTYCLINIMLTLQYRHLLYTVYDTLLKKHFQIWPFQSLRFVTASRKIRLEFHALWLVSVSNCSIPVPSDSEDLSLLSLGR